MILCFFFFKKSLNLDNSLKHPLFLFWTLTDIASQYLDIAEVLHLVSSTLPSFLRRAHLFIYIFRRDAAGLQGALKLFLRTVSYYKRTDQDYQWVLEMFNNSPSLRWSTARLFHTFHFRITFSYATTTKAMRTQTQAIVWDNSLPTLQPSLSKSLMILIKTNSDGKQIPWKLFNN